MKKMIAILLSAVLMISCSTVALAETTTVTTTVPPATYTLNVPESYDVPYGQYETAIGTISVTDSDGFATGKNLEVYVEHEDFTCTDTNTTIPYEIFVCAGIDDFSPSTTISDTIPMTFKGQDDGSVSEFTKHPDYKVSTDPLKAIAVRVSQKDWKKALAGTYTSTITYRAEVVVAE